MHFIKKSNQDFEEFIADLVVVEETGANHLNCDMYEV